MMSLQRLLAALVTLNFTIWFSLLLCSALSAQSSASSIQHPASELAFILSCNPILNSTRSDTKTHIYPDISQVPGIGSFFTGAIRFYQLFISTQDMPVCNFTPSCSQFGAESIRQFGPLRGILLTADRLERCNSMSISRYQIDYKSGRLVDPVQLYVEIFNLNSE